MFPHFLYWVNWKRCNSIAHSSNQTFQFTKFSKMYRDCLHLWDHNTILDFVLAISFSCCSHDLTIIKKNHTFSNSLLVTVVAQFTTKTICYFLSLMSYSTNKLKPQILITRKKHVCFPIAHTKKFFALTNMALATPRLLPLPQCLRPSLKLVQSCFHNSLSYLKPMPHFYSNASQYSGAIKVCKSFTSHIKGGLTENFCLTQQILAVKGG